MVDGELRGVISDEVVNDLVTLMAGVIGNDAVEIVLRHTGVDEHASGRDLVFRFAEETEKLFGPSGGYAILRQVGRDLARKVAAALPEDRWQEALEQSLNDFGFAQRIETCDGRAEICSCVFHPVLEGRGLAPTEHAVCWAGWGFIEGFLKVMDGIRGIEFVGRDLDRRACTFAYLD